MKKNFKDKIIVILLLFVSTLFNFVAAQANGEIPPPPSNTGRSVGPGAPSAPIDMYQIFLLAVAVMMIVYFYKRVKLARN